MNNLEVSMQGPKHVERLKIAGAYPQTPQAHNFFYNMAIGELVAFYLPKQINVDAPVAREFRDLIRSMYRDAGEKSPKIEAPIKSIDFSFPKTQRGRVAVGYSAGKETLWNMLWTQKRYGADKVLGVHIHGLNRAVASEEHRRTLEQQEALGFKNIQIVELKNSSELTGPYVMRSRDMILMGIIGPVAMEWGASKLITEEFAMDVDDEGRYAGSSSYLDRFNGTFESLGIPIELAWKHSEQTDVVKDLLKHKPDWLGYVNNCFAPTCYKPNNRRYWEKTAPTFPLYESQCGSCVKCRITNVARILYDPTLESVKTEDIQTYLKKAIAWIRRKIDTHEDMLAGTFMRDFKKACRMYKVEIPDDIKEIKDR